MNDRCRLIARTKINKYYKPCQVFDGFIKKLGINNCFSRFLEHQNNIDIIF